MIAAGRMPADVDRLNGCNGQGNGLLRLTMSWTGQHAQGGRGRGEGFIKSSGWLEICDYQQSAVRRGNTGVSACRIIRVGEEMFGEGEEREGGDDV
jgi:hypothetical protein